ncbi:MAG: glycosyltransferase family 2 protein [Actinomycetota bacterium]
MAQMKRVEEGTISRPRISAIILSYERRGALETVLNRLEELPVDEIVVFDNASTDGTAEMVKAREDPAIRLIESPTNVGFAGRNAAVEAATGEFMLMLDDDAYPLPGAVEKLAAALMASPTLAVGGGLVIDVDQDERVVKRDEAGTFDWFFRSGSRDADPADGFPVFFFPEGACMIRRSAFLDVGGFFGAFFFAGSESDLTTRLLGRGWDVRYFPDAGFNHMRATEGKLDRVVILRYRVRNQIWYFYRHFPWFLAALRIPAYLAFDLIECAYRGAVRGWVAGIVAAWKERDLVRGTRRPLPRATIRRAEMNRGRIHFRLLWAQLVRRLPGNRGNPRAAS